MSATEYVILVDKDDKELGLHEKISAHRLNLLHRAFSVFLFRQNKGLELLLQKRAANKYHSAGLWTNTCCSHPRQDEDIVAAGERRLYEELTIKASLRNIGWFHYNAHFANGLAENEIDHILIGEIASGTLINPAPNEVQSIRWVSLSVLKTELESHPESFTPWFAKAYGIVLRHLQS